MKLLVVEPRPLGASKYRGQTGGGRGDNIAIVVVPGEFRTSAIWAAIGEVEVLCRMAQCARGVVVWSVAGMGGVQGWDRGDKGWRRR